MSSPLRESRLRDLCVPLLHFHHPSHQRSDMFRLGDSLIYVTNLRKKLLLVSATITFDSYRIGRLLRIIFTEDGRGLLFIFRAIVGNRMHDLWSFEPQAQLVMPLRQMEYIFS